MKNQRRPKKLKKSYKPFSKDFYVFQQKYLSYLIALWKLEKLWDLGNRLTFKIGSHIFIDLEKKLDPLSLIREKTGSYSYFLVVLPSPSHQWNFIIWLSLYYDQ